MRAFCGFRLSAIRNPAFASRVPRNVRPLPARVRLHHDDALCHGFLQRLEFAGRREAGANPAETMPLAPAAMKARTAVPSPPA